MKKSSHHIGSGWLIYIILAGVSVALSLFVVKNYTAIRSLLFPMSPTRKTASIPSVPTPTPTPIKLHKGKGAYAISQNNYKGPAISMVTLDPLDVRKGQTLSIMVKFDSSTPVQSANAIIETDGSPVTIPLQQKSVSGTTYEWDGSTTLADSLWYRYVVTVTAKSSNGENKITVAPRGD